MWTILVALVFFGIVIWVFRTNKSEFDQAAQIPFQENDESQTEELTEKNHG